MSGEAAGGAGGTASLGTALKNLGSSLLSILPIIAGIAVAAGAITLAIKAYNKDYRRIDEFEDEIKELTRRELLKYDKASIPKKSMVYMVLRRLYYHSFYQILNYLHGMSCMKCMN